MMSRARSIFLGFLMVTLMGGASCDTASSQSIPVETLTIESGEQTHRFTVEVPRNEAEITYGLMNRPALDEDAGMIFLFDPPRPVGFWMKDTLIHLDMIFIGDDGMIVGIHPMAQPHDETVIGSGIPVTAVLEIKGGMAQKLDIQPGDTIHMDGL